jgi:PAS domain S-box-containing protein
VTDDPAPAAPCDIDLLRAIGASVADLLYAKDRDSRMLYANPATLAVIGRAEAEVLGRAEAEWHRDPAQAAEIRAADRRVIETGAAETLVEVFTAADGVARVYESTKAPLRDRSGAIAGVVGVSRDVTERLRAARHRALLVAELNHRVKNALTAVQGLARQTLRPACDAARFERFDARLRALARAHDTLSEGAWDAACLRRIVEAALADPLLGVDPARVRIEGSSICLDPRAALTLAMALHELVANAREHGALAGPDGDVEIAWRLEGDKVALGWRERGAAAPTPARRGFGLRYLEAGAPGEIDGEATLAFDQEGLRWDMRFSPAGPSA